MIEYTKPAYLCFGNLEKDFDRLRLEDVRHLLYNRPLDIMKLIEDIFVRTKTEFSPLFFNLVLDAVIKKWKEKEDIK